MRLYSRLKPKFFEQTETVYRPACTGDADDNFQIWLIY